MVLSSTFLDAIHILLQVQGPLDLKLENLCFITEEFKSSAQNLWQTCQCGDVIYSRMVFYISWLLQVK